MKHSSNPAAPFLSVVALALGLIMSSSERVQGAAIPGLFNTGVNHSGVVQPYGSAELHMAMTGLRTNASVIQRPPAWTAAPAGAEWIGPVSGFLNAPSGCCYFYTLQFDLTGLDHTTAVVTGQLASDDQTRILINGVDIGFDNSDVTFTVLRPFTISSGFVSGPNVLQFRVFNCEAPECTFNPSGLLVANLAGTAEPAGPPVQVHWDGNAAVLPHEMNPPYTLAASGNVAAYRTSDGSPIVGYLISTQAVDNVYFEQAGSRLQMTNHLIIEAVLRLVGGATTAANRGPAGITFTTANNVGGSVWFNHSNLFVTAAGDVRGASTNLDTATNYHTYRIEVQGVTNGSPYTVFYDNVAVLNGALYNSPATFGAQPRIQWGEVSGAAYGESRWYSFSHNAGAPFTTLTNPAVELACTSTNIPSLPVVSAPFMSLASEGRITNGTSFHYANLGLIFNTDDGVIYTGTPSGYNPLDSGPRRTFTQSDGSQIMLFEFTDLTINGVGVRVTGSRAAAILATGDIQLIRGAHLEVDAAGDPGAPVGSSFDAGFNALAPLGGGGGRGTASGYSAGEPPYLTPGKLPTSGPGGGGFVSRGQDGIPAEPVRMWRYNGPPTFDFTLLGTLYRPGGEGGGTYTNFSVLRGGGAGGSSSGTGFAGNSGFPGGRGGGALFLSASGRILIDGRSSVSVDGQTIIGFLSEIAAGGAGGYLVLNASQGIFNQGSLSARGGGGRKTQYTSGGTTIAPWWGSSGDGSGGLIVLKSAAGVTNSGALIVSGGGGGGEVCTLGALQPQTPFFVNLPPRLLNPMRTGNQFTFNFTAATNQAYEVQRNDDLNTTNWVTFTNLTGAGFPANILSPTPGVTNRFFRIRAK